MKSIIRIFPLLLIFSCPVLVLGQDGNKQPQWYEIIGGVLAIPVTLIGLAYSYILIKKTNLESRKIELEISEKEDLIIEKGITRSEELKEIVAPFVRTQIIHQIILRYIILEIISRLFGIFAGGYSFLINGISVFSYNRNFDATLVTAVIMILQFLPQIGFTLITISLGYPLFKDVNKLIGLDVKTIFFPFSKRKDKIIG